MKANSFKLIFFAGILAITIFSFGGCAVSRDQKLDEGTKAITEKDDVHISLEQVPADGSSQMQ